MADSFSRKSASGLSGHVMVVDDDRVMRALLASQLEELDYTVTEAGNGQIALQILSQDEQHIDVILLDRQMPEMDGMAFLQNIKAQTLQSIPVVMVTGSGKSSDITEGLNAGVFYYLVKPFDHGVLASVVSSAIKESRYIKQLKEHRKQYQHIFSLLTRAHLTLQTMNQAKSISAVLALGFPDPERVAFGLNALLENAVEHGNYGLGRTKKAALLANGVYHEELRRLEKEITDKNVEVIFEKINESCKVTIRDKGNGFDWANYQSVQPDVFGHYTISRATRVSFDAMAYNNTGNEVTAFVYGAAR